MKYYLLSVFVFFGCVTSKLSATHLQGGAISYERISNTSLTYRITISLMTERGSVVEAGSGDINFGDGTIINVQDLTPTVVVTPLNDNTDISSFELEYTYSSSGTYEINYTERNRNADLLNMNNSVDTPFYIENNITLDPIVGHNSGPVIRNFPSNVAQTGLKFMYNPALFDAEGDSLSYELATPMQLSGQTVNNYTLPNDPKFYSEFVAGNEDQTGTPIISMNRVTGNLVWDAPGTSGNYSLALKVKEWRKVGGEDILLSSSLIDFEVGVEEATGGRPNVTLPSNTCYDGTNAIETITISPINSIPVRVSVFTTSSGTTLNGVNASDFNQSSDFIDSDQEVLIEMDDNESFDFYSIVFKVEQKDSGQGELYSWSKGFVYGFECDTVGRKVEEPVIASVENKLTDEDVFKIYLSTENGKIMLNSNAFQTGRLDVLTLTGKRVIQQTLKPNHHDFSFKSNISPGLYIARLELDGAIYSKRVLVL